MKRILINATHNEEIRVALCKDNHLYDFDLENRTREQKKANIYKGHITRVEPSLEAAFVEYGSARQGFLPLREIASEYLHGNAREDSIKQLIKEGDEVIVQVEKEERGNKGAALSTYISLAGRYLVLMPNNAKAGGISRQISGKVREEMKQIIANLNLPKGMSVIVRTAGLGKGAEDLQNDLDHLLDIWKSIQEQNKNRPSPCLVHQEAGVVTRAVRDYLRDDIGEVWIDSENAYNEAANFIAAVMPAQMSKLRKYTEYEPMFARFGIERQIETAYQREVRLPSGGSIVIDQTEAMVAIDINSSKSTKGSDVAETAFHTNLEAADEIARQLRLRDMGGLIVIDFIDMNDPRHQKEVEKRLVEATRHDRARVQFAEISKFGLMEMSRQRLRPSLEESTGYICPRCHGNGMIRDLRSLSLSIMRQIEQIALKERMGEIQAEVPTDIAAFLLNEKRESLVYLEQDSGARITILPHAHLESPNFSLHFNPDGFAPSSYERIADTEEKETIDRGYEVNWQTDHDKSDASAWHQKTKPAARKASQETAPTQTAEPQAVAWLSNLFAPKPQAKLAGAFGSQDAASAIEQLVNGGSVSLGVAGTMEQIIEPAPKASVSHDDARKAKKQKPAKKDKVIIEEVAVNDKKAKKEGKENKEKEFAKRESGSRRESRGEIVRQETLTPKTEQAAEQTQDKKEKAHSDKPVKDKAARQKHTTPNEVVMRVSQTAAEEEVAQAVHLSLDGSKPKAKKAKADAPKAIVEPAESAQEPTQVDAPITPVLDTTDTPNETADAPQVAKQDTVPNDVAQTTVQIVATPVQAELRSRLEQMAAQMGKAVNDPRVVMAVLSDNKPTGTAGEFIAKQLGANASGDFVADFLTAYTKPSSAELSFANFGYSPLSETQMADYAEQIKATAIASATQGKTEVAPRPISRRAANDPRGQHPDFVEQSDAVETIIEPAEPITPTVIDADEAINANAENNTLPTADDATQDTIVDNAEPTVQDEPVIADEASTENADTQPNSVAVAQTLPFDEPTDELATNDDDVSSTKKGTGVKQLRADQKPEKKSKANSYKDMIENVAGQLQPKVGILNLMTPKAAVKAPKARTRKASKKDNKPKSEVVVRKPKVETDAPSGDE